ncbi:MAG: hypothetical protein Q7Q73_08755 [Verrucomicrobiota bacterium JB024]|nr:hypothetical protein [Verrucomicrobiota bacterium JB024]
MMKSFLTTCLCLFSLGLSIPVCLGATETAPTASPAKTAGGTVRDKAMGPDVKLANPFRYQPPPIPLIALPPVTPNHAEGATMRVVRVEEIVSVSKPDAKTLTNE